MFTHVVFSAGLVCYVARALGLPPAEAILLAAFAAVMQVAIDVLSHETVYTGSATLHRRTPFLHSPSGALLSAAVFTAVLAYVLRPDGHALPVLFASMLVASYSHLLLDLFTERGIYVRGKRVWRKRMFKYDNPLLNLVFTSIGIFLLIESLQPHP